MDQSARIHGCSAPNSPQNIFANLQFHEILVNIQRPRDEIEACELFVEPWENYETLSPPTPLHAGNEEANFASVTVFPKVDKQRNILSKHREPQIFPKQCCPICSGRTCKGTRKELSTQTSSSALPLPLFEVNQF